MTRELVIRTSIEWWKSLGKRSLADLREIVAHQCQTYAIPSEQSDGMASEAWERIPKETTHATTD